jgi:hypothetical protein
MNFYQEIITQKSFRLLQEIKKKFAFTLIGGWAVWVYTKALKSKDIDIIVDYDVLEVLKRDFAVTKNERLRKYEARIEEIEIDIYLPYYSNPGLPPQFIQKHQVEKEGFRLPQPEILLILKQEVFEKRKVSVKGQKDKLDIFSLLTLDLDYAIYKKILKEVSREELEQELRNLLAATKRVKELGLKNHQLAKLREKVFSELG